MDLFSELIAAVQSDLNVSSTASLFNLTVIKLALNRAYRKAGGLFRWPETEDAKKTSTVAGQEYYDYPQNWRPDSVWKLEVDGVDFKEPLVFKDYEYEIANSFINNGRNYQDKNIWSSQWRRYFIQQGGAPPATDGNNNIQVWGQKVVDKLVNDSDTTIFSYSMPECNDAIVEEADAILRAKSEENNTSQFRSSTALQILTTAWNKVRQDQTKYQTTQPAFNVPDFYPDRKKRGNSSDGSPIGNF